MLVLAAACSDVQHAVAPVSPPTNATVLANQSAYVLRGTVVTPDDVIKHGYVAVVDGRIVSISEAGKRGRADTGQHVKHRPLNLEPVGLRWHWSL